MVGLKLLDYGFNTSRVTSSGEMKDGFRNFNVFYEMLIGLDETEKVELGLVDYNQFSYIKGYNSSGLARSGTLGRLTLGRSKSLSRSKSIGTKTAHPDATPNTRDQQEFNLLREHLKSLGIGNRTQAQIYRVLAGILHLGNIVFVDNTEQTTTNAQQTTDIKNPESLNTCANLLSVAPEQLKNTMLYKSKVLGKDTFSVCLNAEQAREHRDMLAQTIYGMLFTWIVEHINTRLCKKEGEFDLFIGITDFPSILPVPQGSHSAKFELLFSNYCFEKMHCFAQTELFENNVQQLTIQGLKVQPVKYNDNQVVVDLFDGTDRITGLWSLLESNTLVQVPSDSSFGQELARNLDKNLKPNAAYQSSYECNTVEKSFNGFSKPLFGIKHHGNLVAVEYDVESFYEQDAVLADFVALFRGTLASNSESQSTFIANLFSQKNGLQIIDGNLKLNF